MPNLNTVWAKLAFSFSLSLVIFNLTGAAHAQNLAGACPFSATDADELARCLIRRVKQGASLDPTPAQLPEPLKQIVGKETGFTVEQLARFLREKNVSEADVGGAVAARFKKTRFFVIHDTSTPNLLDKDFPVKTKPDGTIEQIINTAEWRYNDFDLWLRQDIPTHIFVNRLGESKTKNDFGTQTVLATKYELAKLTAARCSQRPDLCEPNWRERVRERSGLFVHVELVQPRHCLRLVAGCKNDLIAPKPGFTDKQLNRLALLYIVASVRRGVWLMPAFHAPVDAGRQDGHDDPQNFEISVWTRELQTLLNELKESSAANPTADNLTTGDSFDFPEPRDLSNGKILWATHYFVPVVSSVPVGEPLLDSRGNRLGPVLSKLDWCKAALEGTVSVKDDNRVTTYNFAVRAATLQVDCSHISNEEIRKKIGRNRFALSKGNYGDGVQSMILVPYRTIAVDPNFIPFNSLVYIPDARGKEIVLPSGQTVKHDGYFYAADAGSAIGGNHIDVFAGLFAGNPFPQFIKSDKTKTFKAFLIDDAQIRNTLKRFHTGN